jgi:hypothetical protein
MVYTGKSLIALVSHVAAGKSLLDLKPTHFLRDDQIEREICFEVSHMSPVDCARSRDSGVDLTRDRRDGLRALSNARRKDSNFVDLFALFPMIDDNSDSYENQGEGAETEPRGDSNTPDVEKEDPLDSLDDGKEKETSGVTDEQANPGGDLPPERPEVRENYSFSIRGNEEEDRYPDGGDIGNDIPGQAVLDGTTDTGSKPSGKAAKPAASYPNKGKKHNKDGLRADKPATLKKGKESGMPGPEA